MLFKYKYPKLTLLVLAIILAYFLFKNPAVSGFVASLGKLSYFGAFIAGLFFPFGFTAPFSVGFFVTLNPESIILYGLIGAFGATISNLFIFSLVRFSFKEEIANLEKSLEKTRPVKELEREFNVVSHIFGKHLEHYLLYAIVGIIIASPISDEIADVILGGMTKIRIEVLAIISFVLSFLGILVLLSI